jgi:hypothetical protein
MDIQDLEICNCRIPTLPQRIARKLKNIGAEAMQKAHERREDSSTGLDD